VDTHHEQEKEVDGSSRATRKLSPGASLTQSYRRPETRKSFSTLGSSQKQEHQQRLNTKRNYYQHSEEGRFR